jgi:hypothetical protein
MPSLVLGGLTITFKTSLSALAGLPKWYYFAKFAVLQLKLTDPNSDRMDSWAFSMESFPTRVSL